MDDKLYALMRPTQESEQYLLKVSQLQKVSREFPVACASLGRKSIRMLNRCVYPTVVDEQVCI